MNQDLVCVYFDILSGVGVGVGEGEVGGIVEEGEVG